MNLDEISAGERVFIDANIFIYHFTGVSEQCSRFLLRCEQGELTGVTSMNVVLEVLHRLMMVEAVNKKLLDPPNIVKKLQKNPNLVKQLSDASLNTQKIFDMGIMVKPVNYEVFLKSQFYRNKYGLLANDSMAAASVQQESILIFATNDNAFLTIQEFNVYQPSDVK